MTIKITKSNLTNFSISQSFWCEKLVLPIGVKVDQFHFTKRAPVSVDTGATWFNRDYGN